MKKKEVACVFKYGTRSLFKHGVIFIYDVKEESCGGCVIITPSKYNKRAVDRNYIKRCIRECIKKTPSLSSKAIVFIIQNNKKNIKDICFSIDISLQSIL